MKAVMNELEKSPDVILFIDELHTIVGAPAVLQAVLTHQTCSSRRWPAVKSSAWALLRSTNIASTSKKMVLSTGVSRKLLSILLQLEETIDILHNIKEKYEEHHNVRYSE